MLDIQKHLIIIILLSFTMLPKHCLAQVGNTEFFIKGAIYDSKDKNKLIEEEITIGRLGYTAEVTTENGYFEMMVPKGKVEFYLPVNSERYALENPNFTITADTTIHLYVTDRLSTQLTGIISTDCEEKITEQVNITVGDQAKSTTDGTFDFNVTKGETTTLEITSHGYQGIKDTIQIQGNDVFNYYLSKNYQFSDYLLPGLADINRCDTKRGIPRLALTGAALIFTGFSYYKMQSNLNTADTQVADLNGSYQIYQDHMQSAKNWETALWTSAGITVTSYVFNYLRLKGKWPYRKNRRESGLISK